MLRMRVDRYRQVEIIGRVQDCESARDAVEASASQGDVVMIMGYCHIFSGPYLWIYNLRDIRGPRIGRRLQNFGRADYGDLKPAPDEWPHRSEVEALAGQFRGTALKGSRDLDAAALPGYGQQAASGRAQFVGLSVGTHSPFDHLNSEHVILIDNDTYDDPAEYRATVCFCRSGSCSGRWPIAGFDADNLPDRPYACSKIEPYVINGRDTQAFDTPEETSGLAEPR
jgi:hypothetical protein